MKKPISVFLIAILHLTFIIGHLSSAFAAEYVLAPSDQLEVKLIGQKDLDTKQAIAPDGTISLPLVGRVTAQGQTLNSFNNYLSAEFAKYIKNPQVVIYLTPRPIYVIQHDLKKNTWDVKEAKSIPEAQAYMGVSSPNSQLQTPSLNYGDIVSVEVGEKPDWWEGNWYKVVTATAVVASVYSMIHK